MIDIVTLTKEPPAGFENACAVYRFADGNGSLLYVGMTKDPQKRIATHSCGSEWFKNAAKVSISWHSSREDALNAEARAIFEGKPMFNKSCALRRVSDAYRVKTRVKVMRSKKQKTEFGKGDHSLIEPISLAGESIRLWCARDGRKLGWIAAQVPVANSSLSRWMMGRVIPSAVYRYRMADITGIEALRDEGNWIAEGALA